MPRKFGGREMTNEWISAADLFVDAQYQRPLRENVVRTIVENFDPDAIGTLYVSRRSDGRNALLDGQQRREATSRALGPSQKLPCLVYHGLSEVEEARLFVEFNRDRTKPHPIEIFRAEVAAHQEPASTITRLLSSRGLSVAQESRNPKVVRFPVTLKDVYRKAGEEHFLTALDVLLDAGYGVEEPIADQLFQGVALFVVRYANLLDTVRLSRVLDGSQTGMITRARMLRSEISAYPNLATAILRLLVERYNKRLSRPLPWVEVTARTTWRPIRVDDLPAE